MHDLDRMTHPTVHEVVVGDRHLPIDGDRADPAGMLDMLSRKMSDAALRRRARNALLEMFDPKRSALSASTTLCGLVAESKGDPYVRMRLDNGRNVFLALHQVDDVSTYSVGYERDGETLWAGQDRLHDLPSRTARGSRLAERLLA